MLRILLPLLVLLLSCQTQPEPQSPTPDLFLNVLGVAQDAGYPQIGCQKTCCQRVHEGRHKAERVVSLGVVDRVGEKNWLFEATPDIKVQVQDLYEAHPAAGALPQGIFLTHAHMGHYTGLMQLGREAFGAKGVKVYAMPRMKAFLQSQAPWSQLVQLNNIQLVELAPDSGIQLSPELRVKPLLVPHRDEFSETVGYRIEGPRSKILFIPDIDKWQKWERDIIEEVRLSTHAFLDATFYNNAELPNRDMSEIPHPFVEESMRLFDSLSAQERAKIHFIHFNHSNPLIWDADTQAEVERKGYKVAKEGMKVEL